MAVVCCKCRFLGFGKVRDLAFLGRGVFLTKVLLFEYVQVVDNIYKLVSSLLICDMVSISSLHRSQ